MGRHRLNLSLTQRFCVSPLVELVGQINQQLARSFLIFSLSFFFEDKERGNEK